MLIALPRTCWLVLITVVLSCGKGSEGTDNTPPPPDPPVVPAGFTNPLLPSGPDPWVIQKGTDYYYTHTQGNRISLWKTPKMSDLRNAPVQTVWTAPASGPNSRNIWAPELHYIDNKWYLYYTAGSGNELSTQRTFVLENSNADPRNGSWADKGKIYDPQSDFFAIDGTVFSYNSRNYFIWSGHASASDNTQRLYIAVMSDPWTLGGPRTLISSPDYAWERAGAPPAVNEAPEILINPQGQVQLIYSASGCWTDDYSLGMLSLKVNGDPLKAEDWAKFPQPVFVKNPSNQAYGPGHNAFFKSVDNSESWIIYHANPNPEQGCGDNRSPRMQKFSWKQDGTPDFGTPVRLNTVISKPSGE